MPNAWQSVVEDFVLNLVNEQIGGLSRNVKQKFFPRISVQREGVYYGQCSEIRGTNHAFMPIIIEAVILKDYADWVSNQLVLQIN